MKPLVITSVLALAMAAPLAAAQKAPPNEVEETTEDPTRKAGETAREAGDLARDAGDDARAGYSDLRNPEYSDAAGMDDNTGEWSDESDDMRGAMETGSQGSSTASANSSSSMSTSGERSVRYLTDEEWAAMQNGDPGSTTRTQEGASSSANASSQAGAMNQQGSFSGGSNRNVQATTASARSADANIRGAFMFMDADNNGVVSRQEWASWQAHPASNTPRFSEYDTDSDGEMDMQEYVSALQDN